MNTLATYPALSAKRVRSFRLRLPVLLFAVLLLPIAPLLLLALLIVWAMNGVNPFRAAMALLRFFFSFRGTHVEVQTNHISFAISLF
jgi:hypothetical protein